MTGEKDKKTNLLPLTEWRAKFLSAFVEVGIGEEKILVVRPVSNKELGGTDNEKKKVGDLTIDNDVVVVVRQDESVVAIALDSVVRNGDFTVEEFDWKEVLKRVSDAEKGVDGKFKLASGMARSGEQVYLPGTTGMVLKPDMNGEINGLLDIIVAANNKNDQ